MTKGHRVGAWYRYKKRGRESLTWLIFCKRCGLVWLNNVATNRAIRAGCEADNDD